MVNKTKSKSSQKRTKRQMRITKHFLNAHGFPKSTGLSVLLLFCSLNDVSVPHTSLLGHRGIHPNSHPIQDNKNIPGELDEIVPFEPASSPHTQRSHLCSAFLCNCSSEVSKYDQNYVTQTHHSATQSTAPFTRTVSPFIVI